MATSTITLKTDTTANWESSNRILALNEPALERTTDGYINMKLGDGVTPWNKLGYVFKLKTLEELNASASTSSSSASEQVTLAKAELAKCVSEYEKTKNHNSFTHNGALCIGCFKWMCCKRGKPDGTQPVNYQLNTFGGSER